MAAQSASIFSLGDAASPKELRDYLTSLVSDLKRGRSMIKAWMLAAGKDSHSLPAIYWPDLMVSLERVLPDEEDLLENFKAFADRCSNGSPALLPSKLVEVDRLRDDFEQHVKEVSVARSMITALRLAAEADSYEKPEIYWPDLMRSLEQLLPEEESMLYDVDTVFAISGPNGSEENHG